MTRFIILFITAFIISACNSPILKKYSDNKPDEFVIITNKELYIPEKFSLPAYKEINEDDLSDEKIILDKLSDNERSLINKTKNFKSEDNIKSSITKKTQTSRVRTLFE